MKETELMDYLIKLKLEKFGNEILDEFNLELLEIVDDGYSISDKNIYN